VVGIALGTALVFGVFAVADAEANGTTPEFIALAERISGQQLDDVFDTWLFTGEKPPPAAVSGGARAARSTAQPATDGADSWRDDIQRRMQQGRY
jgi:hypothetical protein